MTDHDETRTNQDTHALVGAYAVDALDDIERARFEAHLRQCPACRDEVDGLREAAAMLGTIDEVAPPASLREAVLAGIDEIRPLPPENPTAPEARPARSARSGGSRRRTWLSRTPLLVAAALVTLLAFGVALTRPWVDDQPSAPQITAAEQVLGADDATRVEKRFPDGAEATVVVSRSLGQALILTNDMASAPEGKVFQLWFQTPAGEFRSAGLMPDVRDATVLLEGDASRAVGVGITVEPNGGSKQPTSDPIAFFTLAS